MVYVDDAIGIRSDESIGDDLHVASEYDERDAFASEKFEFGGFDLGDV